MSYDGVLLSAYPRGRIDENYYKHNTAPTVCITQGFESMGITHAH